MPSTLQAAAMRKNWRNVPDRRSATYYRRAAVLPAAYAAGVTVTNLWHRIYKNTPKTGTPGVYLIYEADLFFPKETNPSFATTTIPLPGDQIQDAAATTIPYTGVRWTIYDMDDAGGQGCWKMHAVFPFINAALGIAVQIQNPTVSITAAGGRNITGWTNIAANAAQTAWVQDTPTGASNVLGKRQIPDTSTIYLPQSVVVDAQSTVLETSSGTRFTIKETRPARELTELFEMDIEVIN